jgi:hypothetical protein
MPHEEDWSLPLSDGNYFILFYFFKSTVTRRLEGHSPLLHKCVYDLGVFYPLPNTPEAVFRSHPVWRELDSHTISNCIQRQGLEVSANF